MTVNGTSPDVGNGAFRRCFVVGALAGFAGVAIASAVPRRRAGSADHPAEHPSSEPVVVEVG